MIDMKNEKPIERKLIHQTSVFTITDMERIETYMIDNKVCVSVAIHDLVLKGLYPRY